jgi:hypothetical protein
MGGRAKVSTNLELQYAIVPQKVPTKVGKEQAMKAKAKKMKQKWIFKPKKEN